MTDLRKAAQQALDALEAMMAEFNALDLPYGSKAYALAKDARLDLRAALTTQPSPEWWRSGLAATLMREGINKHRAREIADGYWAAYCEIDARGAND